MFKFMILAALLAFAAAAESDVNAEITELTSDVRPDGFNYAVGTSNGIHEVAAGDASGNVQGSYEYTSPEGEHISVTYTADDSGYHPVSDHLPQPHPIPPHILKAIEYIHAHPPKE
ncbi:larval cuticle protein 4-like [Musca autumnalis]|uniref:larval cuticle protein 4-like n=1 Tax=Musca autumnalis TaxID=221902 RepID=UPI003CF468C4